MNRVFIDESKINNFLRELFVGMKIYGFHFSMFYEIYFYKSIEENKFHDIDLPYEFNILIENDWWINSKDKYDAILNKENSTFNDRESILAKELVELKWKEDIGEINDVYIENNTFIMQFQSDKTINIDLSKGNGSSFEIYSKNLKNDLSVIVEGNDFFCSYLKNYDEKQ